jgi:hypothetical protein
MLGRAFILIPILWQAGALTTYLRLGPTSYDSSFAFLLEFDRHRGWLVHGELVYWKGGFEYTVARVTSISGPKLLGVSGLSNAGVN